MAEDTEKISDNEWERGLKRLAEADAARRRDVARKSLAIDKLFKPVILRLPMTKQQALLEARSRLGPAAFAWRLDTPSPAGRFVVGVLREFQDKTVAYAAGSGSSWEAAFENQEANHTKYLGDLRMKTEAIEKVAEICHEANRGVRKVIGEDPGPGWAECPDEMKDSSKAGVAFRLKHPDAPAATQHEAWMTQKKADGWTHGPTKDPVAKTHPQMVPYEQLPPEQRLKDYVFAGIVMAWRFCFETPLTAPVEASAEVK